MDVQRRRDDPGSGRRQLLQPAQHPARALRGAEQTEVVAPHDEAVEDAVAAVKGGEGPDMTVVHAAALAHPDRARGVVDGNDLVPALLAVEGDPSRSRADVERAA